jgi:hypothetical protein
MNRAKRPRRIYNCTFPYLDAGGAEVFQVVKWRLVPPVPRPKEFTYRWRRGPGYAWVDRKHERADDYLYQLPDLLAALPTADRAHWTEGEKCADAIRAVGAVATSHHGGAGKATRAQARTFKGFTGTVVLVADRDIPGADCAARRYDLLRKVGIPAKRLRIVIAADEATPDVEHPGTDAFDHLAFGLGLEDFRPVSIATARRYAATLTPALQSEAGYAS